MKRAARIVGLLAALGLPVWLLLRAPLSPAGEERTPPPPAFADLDRPVEAALEEARVPEAAVDSSPEETLLVRVVETGTGAPVPGARVFVADPDAHPLAWEEAEETMREPFALLAAGLGREYMADEQGCVRLEPAQDDLLWVAGELDSRRALSVLEPGVRECTLELRPCRELRAEVVDSRGVPAPGVRVALLVSYPESGWDVLWTDTTGADGSARILALELSAEGTEGFPLALGLPLARGRPDLVQFSLEEPPASPVRFVVEETGTVVVLLTDSEDRPLQAEGWARLNLAAESASGLHPAFEIVDSNARLVGGRARFERVGLGLELVADGFATWHRIDSRGIRGPRSSAEEVVVKLRSKGLLPVLTGSAVDGDGVPLVDAFLRGEAWSGGEVIGRTSAHTIDGGSFLTVLRGPAWRDGADLGHRWSFTLSTERGLLFAEAHHPRASEEGRFELGTLQFRAKPPLASGRVLDDLARPVAYAYISIGSENVDNRLEATHTDEDGRFLVYGAAEELPASIEAEAQDFLGEPPVMLTHPGQELTLRLHRAAALEGRLLIPDGLETDSLRLGLQWPAFLPAEAMKTEGFRGSGHFRCTQLPAGSCNVTVRLDGLDLGVMRNVVLEPAQTTVLEPIDLQGILFAIEVELIGPGGEAVRDGFVARDLPDQWPEWRRTAPAGRARIASASSLVDIIACGPGLELARFEGVASGSRLQLGPGVPLVLKVPADLEPADPSLSLCALAWPAWPEEKELRRLPEGLWRSTFACAEGGQVRMLLPAPGAYEIEWLLHDAATGRDHELAFEGWQPVRVPSTGAVAAEIDSEALRDAGR